MRTLALAIGFSLVSWCVSSQEQTPAPPQITAVHIQGLERVAEQVVRAKLEVQPGQPYQPRAVARDIRRLYELGHFANIKVDAQPDGAGVALTYQLEEKRAIDEVRIIGNKKLSERRIRGVLSWREGDTFVADGYEQEREAILDLYASKGFANATVDIVAEEAGPSRVRVTYNIDEGRKARIRSISFVGNDTLATRRLQKIMKTRKAIWFVGGRFNEDKFEQDLQEILAAYGDKGRLEAAIPRTEITFSDNGKGMHITVYLTEGPEYTVETVQIAENIVYDEDEIRGLIAVEEGDVHNKSQVTADAELVAKGYQDSGYVNAQVTPQVTLDRESKTTHVVHQVSEGDLKYIREIRITGNEVTKDEVIRRQMLLRPGDRFDGSAVQLSQRRLDNTRYFDTTRITLSDVLEDDMWTNLLVDVEEGDTGTFNFGAGYSTEDKFGGFAELRLTNVDITNWPKFSGGGQQLSLRLNTGDRHDTYSLSFTDPEIWGYPLSFGFDVYDDSYRYSGTSYREDQAGGQLRFGKVLSPFLTTRWSLRYQDTEISDVPFEFLVNPELREISRDSTTISTAWSIERNTVDNVRDATSGADHIFTLELAGLGGDNEFVKVDQDSTWYWSLSEENKWVLSLRSRHGWVTPYGGSDYVPLQDRYFAGGSSTVRGYDNRDIGPRTHGYLWWGDEYAIGGELRMLTSVEVKYKVSDLLRLYAFVDSGGVWEEAGDFGFGDVKYSAGLGIGMDVPRLGPFRLDYGIPINPDDDQGSGRLHLTTGFRF
ncbi:MAG: outer membrane protein assembly factor BamA [Candidatus Hydrogenedentes bacterium]|nr:outer membrane protein assembly factor BamA [Candidatus Hydrogenedentota bacterium]